jgi:predicted ATPase
LHQLAIMGRQFPLSLVRQVVPQPEEELYHLLSSLQRKEFLYEQPAFPESEYIFKHALTQEVAYGTVLQEQRKLLHERTGQALEVLYVTSLDEHYSELAHHYTRSGHTEKAVEYLHLAGQQAVQRSANVEAITHLTTALELLKTLPDTAEHTEQELRLHLALGPVLFLAKGCSSAEAERVYTRALELCRQVAESPQLFLVLWGLFLSHLGQGRLQAARELGEQLLSLTQHGQDPAVLLLAHRVLGEILFWSGEFVPAQAHLEQSIALYNPQQHHSSLVLLYGEDIGVASRSFAAWALWFLGYPDQALRRYHETLTLVQGLSHPLSLIVALFCAALLHQYRREGQTAQERAEAVMALSAEQGFPDWLAWGTMMRGWALAEQGQEEEGITQIRQGLAAYRAIGGETMGSYFLALVAEAYGQVGQSEEGFTVLAEALAVVDRTGERFYEAELYRIKGTLTLQKFQVSSFKLQVEESLASSVQHLESEAEEYFLKAVEIARKQQAKSWELRATVSLAKLWQQQGRQKDAHQMLAQICNWFTEGFDTRDLQEAKALLDALS